MNNQVTIFLDWNKMNENNHSNGNKNDWKQLKFAQN